MYPRVSSSPEVSGYPGLVVEPHTHIHLYKHQLPHCQSQTPHSPQTEEVQVLLPRTEEVQVLLPHPEEVQVLLTHPEEVPHDSHREYPDKQRCSPEPCRALNSAQGNIRVGEMGSKIKGSSTVRWNGSLHFSHYQMWFFREVYFCGIAQRTCGVSVVQVICQLVF